MSRLRAVPLMAVLLLPACSSKHDAVVPPPIESVIFAEVHETYSPAGRALRLDLRTQREYGCFNFRIDAALRTAGQAGWNVDIDGVEAPNICLTAIGPARASFTLGAPVIGDRVLLYDVQGAGMVAHLVVDDATLRLEGDGPATPVRFPLPTLRRVPPQSAWGFVAWATPAEEAKALQFLDALEAAGAEPIALEPGDYDVFLVDDAGTVRWPGNGFNHARAFAHHVEAGAPSLQDVVAEFDVDGLQIAVYDDRGRAVLSWMMP
jgi:hypothetical protein